MKTTCRRCGATWGGTKLEHCVTCHRTFTSTGAGDKHRTGDHAVSVGPDRRRCKTDEELAEAGLTTRTLASGLEVWGRGGHNPWS